MNEFIVEAGPYKGCIMRIKGGSITYQQRPLPAETPSKPDPPPMKLATGIAQPDSPINKGGTLDSVKHSKDTRGIEELAVIDEEPESEDELLGLEKLLTHPGLSVITRNKLIKHLEETELLEHQVFTFYETVVEALLKKKTFKASIELATKGL
jgi:hypothetical protein